MRCCCRKRQSAAAPRLELRDALLPVRAELPGGDEVPSPREAEAPRDAWIPCSAGGPGDAVPLAEEAEVEGKIGEFGKVGEAEMTSTMEMPHIAEMGYVEHMASNARTNVRVSCSKKGKRMAQWAWVACPHCKWKRLESRKIKGISGKFHKTQVLSPPLTSSTKHVDSLESGSTEEGTHAVQVRYVSHYDVDAANGGTSWHRSQLQVRGMSTYRTETIGEIAIADSEDRKLREVLHIRDCSHLSQSNGGMGLRSFACALRHALGFARIHRVHAVPSSPSTCSTGYSDIFESDAFACNVDAANGANHGGTSGHCAHLQASGVSTCPTGTISQVAIAGSEDRNLREDHDRAGVEHVSRATTPSFSPELRTNIHNIVNTNCEPEGWMPKEAQELWSELKRLLEGTTTIEQVGQKAEELFEFFLQDFDQEPGDSNGWSNFKARIKEEGLEEWMRLCSSCLPGKLRLAVNQPGGVTMVLNFALSVFQAVAALRRYRRDGGTEDTFHRVWELIKTGIIPPLLDVGLKPFLATRIGWAYAEKIVAFCKSYCANPITEGDNAAELAGPTNAQEAQMLDLQGDEGQILHTELADILTAGDEYMGPSEQLGESGGAGESKGVSEHLRILWKKVREQIEKKRHFMWGAAQCGRCYSAELESPCQELLRDLLSEVKCQLLNDSGLFDEELRGKLLAFEEMLQQLGIDTVDSVASRVGEFLQERAGVGCKLVASLAACICLARILHAGWRFRQNEISKHELKVLILEEFSAVAFAVVVPQVCCAVGLPCAAAGVACVVAKKLCELGVDAFMKWHRQSQEKENDEAQLQERRTEEEQLQAEEKDEKTLQVEVPAQAIGGDEENEDHSLRDALVYFGLPPHPKEDDVWEKVTEKRRSAEDLFVVWRNYEVIREHYGWPSVF